SPTSLRRVLLMLHLVRPVRPAPAHAAPWPAGRCRAGPGASWNGREAARWRIGSAGGSSSRGPAPAAPAGPAGSDRAIRRPSSLTPTGGEFLAHGELGLDRQFVGSQAHRIPGGLLGQAGTLGQDKDRPDHRHPVIYGALALAHSALGGPFCGRLVGEDPDPHFSSPAHEAHQGPPGGLDLTGGDPTGLQRLPPVIPKGHLPAAAG